MKKVVILVVVAALLAAVSSALCAEKQAEPFTVVTSEEVRAMIDRQEPGLVVIDARSPGEYQEVHIKGALNIPWQMLENNPSALTLP
ncbi:MAG TPA: rhodanese-like domain-containing protein, partial [Geobacteraceae bacterium]|nr:rhodanese-like domain-containing protein [Geobacteraceae bacterium]